MTDNEITTLCLQIENILKAKHKSLYRAAKVYSIPESTIMHLHNRPSCHLAIEIAKKVGINLVLEIREDA